MALVLGCHPSSARKADIAMNGSDRQTADSRSRGNDALTASASDWPNVLSIQYRAFQQVGSAEEEAKAVGYEKSQGTLLQVRSTAVAPLTVGPGKVISLEMEYVVLGAAHELEIAEEWEILQDGRRLTSTSPRLETRGPGGWRAYVSVSLPRETQPGAYTVRSHVRAGKLSDSRDTRFMVVGRAQPRAATKVPGAAAATDDDLRHVQGRLKELGHDPGPVDGRMRPQTETALKAFQQDYGLAATGEIDGETRAALGLDKWTPP